MANFLTRLVERTWGVAPTVKPAIAPLFAPDSAPILESESLSLVANEKPRLDQDNHAQTQPSSTSSNIETQLNSATTQPKPHRDREMLVSQVPSTPITSLPLPDNSLNSNNSQTNSSTASNTPAVRDELVRNNTDNLNDNFSLDFNLEKLPQRQTAQNHQSQKTQKVNSIPNQEIQYLPLSTNTEEHLLPSQPSFNLSKIETKTLTNNKPVSSHHSTTPSSTTTSPPQATSSQTETPTQQTIKVQIGRIEIRAQTPTKPSQSTTPKSQAPRISLDEYLRSHSGGKR
ncbi:MAG: hypothetical protein AAF757_00210 [Cyanobacteria bacterium P01_D01_bin.116]